MEAMSAWALSLGLVEIGEYEEALVLARRGVGLARKAQDKYLLAVNLDRHGKEWWTCRVSTPVRAWSAADSHGTALTGTLVQSSLG